MVRRRQRPDEVQLEAVDQLLVGRGVLAGVIDQGQPGGFAGHSGEAGDELVDDEGELADVGAVTGICAGDQRDAAVDRNHQAEADQAQVPALLLGMAALGDGGSLVG